MHKTRALVQLHAGYSIWPCNEINSNTNYTATFKVWIVDWAMKSPTITYVTLDEIVLICGKMELDIYLILLLCWFIVIHIYFNLSMFLWKWVIGVILKIRIPKIVVVKRYNITDIQTEGSHFRLLSNCCTIFQVIRLYGNSRMIWSIKYKLAR